jgi:hypothetical protein
MVIQFYMRGYNTTAPGAVGYVDWVVNDVPDSTASFVPSPYVPGNITNIIVNRVVQSPVNNFLKPGDSTIIVPGYNNPQDQYLFHLNSYDWINPEANATTGPIAVPPPGQPVGLAVVRGSATSTALPTPFIPSPYSAIFWEESSPQAGAIAGWNFAYINDDGTIGPVTPVSMGSLNIIGHLGVQDLATDPESSTGLIRITNNQSDVTGNTGAIKSRNTNNTGDITLIAGDASNRVQIGSTSDPVYVPGPYLRVDNYIANGNPTTPLSSIGFIRNPALPVNIITAWNNAANVSVVSTNAGLITLGDAVNFGIVYNTATGHEHVFQINSVPVVHVGVNYIDFDATTSNPTISQNQTSVGNGQPLTVQAQKSTGGNGGNVVLNSGQGTSHDGAVIIGSPAQANILAVYPTNSAVTDTLGNPVSGEIVAYESVIGFNGGTSGNFVTAPFFKQNNVSVASGQGPTLTVQAANNQGGSGTGSNLVLTSGTGSSATTAGHVIIETGGVPWIDVNPGTSPFATITINGNLTVLGTTTTIDSTVVDIVGRVIHGNFSVGIVAPPSAPNTVNSMTGYVIHRGSATGVAGQDRDSAGLIYNETSDIYTDGYWKLTGMLHDIDTATSLAGLTATLPLLAAAVVATPNPVQEFGTPKTGIPGTGGFRTLNATPAVTSRNVAATQDLFLVGTNNTDHIILGETPTPFNTGFIFSTSTGSLYDFRVNNSPNNTSQIQLAGLFATATSPALSGIIRIPSLAAQVNTPIIVARNNGNTQDLTLLSTNNADKIIMGAPSSPQNTGFIFNTQGTSTASSNLFDFWNASTSEVQIGSDANGPFVRESATTFVPATTGFVRVPANITAVAARNAGNTGDILLLGTNLLNQILHGDSLAPTNGGHIFSTTTNSIFDFWVNGISQVSIGANEINFTNTDGYANISQSTTFVGNGQTFTVAAQSSQAAASTGGILSLVSGTGASTAGVINFSNGAVLSATMNAIDIEADGYAEWLGIGPTIVNPRLYQVTQTGTGANNGYNFKINAQPGQQQTGANANNNGGNLILATGSAGTGGSGAPGLPGNMQFMVDSTMELELTDGLLQWGAGVLNPPTINQAPTNASVGANFSIAAQNAFGANGLGGNLILSSGFGSLIDGYVDLQVGGVTVAAAEPNKFTFFQGRRRHVTQITGTYNVALSDDLIAITTLSAPFTVFLPTFPFLGDSYEIKDTTGNAGTSNVTVNGNGSNIDGAATYLLNQAYAAVTFTYTGTTWSIT